MRFSKRQNVLRRGAWPALIVMQAGEFSAKPEMLSNDTQKHDLLAILLIASVVALVFGQNLSHQLIGYDDPYFISQVPQVMSGLSWENTQWAWSTSQMSIWHPLTWFSYQLESELFGASNDSARFLVNTLLHLLYWYAIEISIDC